MKDFINFEQDQKALTPSFFSGDSGIINKDDIENLKTYALNNKTTARLNLFSSSDDILQYMLICHPSKKDIKCKKFKNQTSIYTIIEGEIEFNLYDNDLNLEKSFILGKYNFSIRIPKNKFYKFIMKSDLAVFIEIRNGPYIKENKVELSW
ncbi:WbuC family cupin fold metalloprotein [Campylobacter fetus]|uniref:WbuC family cupin fold metalloprotein n=1 Tax=Campylobacter fetus TaxID=196 RepID=UPI000531FBD7|nr:WbuC family cupin fold metalloprotein [Campylobacter fetus]KGT36202.1 hypothetical protein KU70_07800 [Campylobacter fetus]MBD3866248.1 cupin fold metalloprotein, WbuC family [Campylobacter fetus]